MRGKAAYRIWECTCNLNHKNLMYAILQSWCCAIDIYLVHMVNWSRTKVAGSNITKMQIQVNILVIFMVKWSKLLISSEQMQHFQDMTKGVHQVLVICISINYWLVVYCYTSHSKIFHWYRDITISCEELKISGICSVLITYEQGGILTIPQVAQPDRPV